jgi:hypothetical protein
VRLDVDETRADDMPGRVDDVAGGSRVDQTGRRDGGDAVACDRDVAGERRCACAVDDQRAGDERVDLDCPILGPDASGPPVR